MDLMANVSSTFLLLGLVEMEDLRHLYCALSFITYGFIMALSTMIVFVVLTEPSLHEPMYVLICNLVLNGIFGSSIFFPKLLMDLLTSTKTISRIGCLIQSSCLTLFVYIEIATFTLMAYDRFLAICHPLRYFNLMTNKTAAKLILASLVFSISNISMGSTLTSKLYFCRTQIQNIFCDKMSLLILSCVDTTFNKVLAATMWSIYFSPTTLVIVFSYLKIFLICARLSKESRKKAVHTVMTHLICFSVFITGVLFVIIRYRSNGQDLHLATHNLISVISLVTPPLFNPVIYGIRTKVLKVKLIQRLQKLNVLPAARHNVLSQESHIKTVFF